MRGSVIRASGGCRLVIDFDEDSDAGWVIGPEGTSIVFVPDRWRRKRLVIEQTKRPPPPRLAEVAAEHATLQEHPTDRLLSGLTRRLLMLDRYLSPHGFFSFDGHLGLTLRGGEPDDDAFATDRHGLAVLGITTAAPLVEACLTDKFLGIPDAHIVDRTTEWVAVEDRRNGARLLLAWSPR